MIPYSLKRNIFEVMVKSITHYLLIVFIFQQLKSQISQIYQNGFNPFCDKTFHLFYLIDWFIYIKLFWRLLYTKDVLKHDSFYHVLKVNMNRFTMLT